MKEVDLLVLEIQTLDPQRAAHLKQVVDDMRGKK